MDHATSLFSKLDFQKNQIGPAKNKVEKNDIFLAAD
jgi:hypothetical protein